MGGLATLAKSLAKIPCQAALPSDTPPFRMDLARRHAWQGCERTPLGPDGQPSRLVARTGREVAPAATDSEGAHCGRSTIEARSRRPEHDLGAGGGSGPLGSREEEEAYSPWGECLSQLCYRVLSRDQEESDSVRPSTGHGRKHRSGSNRRRETLNVGRALPISRPSDEPGPESFSLGERH